MNKGKHTKQQILATALNIATETSLNDLTIGGLAAAMNMSKSGVFAHFNSKENLQLAVLEHAHALFLQTVIAPIDKQSLPLSQLLRTCELWQGWYQGKACNCIFISAAVEFDDQLGAVRDLVKSLLQSWLSYLNKLVIQAIEVKELSEQTDAKQFTYELYSLYLGSQHMRWVGFEDDTHTRFNLALSRLIQRYQG
ncbi:TetR/AcrR family transcriptional regulator [Pseudoalteromonas holothuriae]|nr:MULTISPECIES: TetR/AcrR family transcriptional regulator [unclassified Pseudoalteromonas]